MSSSQIKRYVIASNVLWESKESVLVYYTFHSGSLHQGSISKGLTKHLLVLFVCNELCLILHNLCSGGHVTEGETEGEREMKTKPKEDKEHLSFAAFPVLFPSEYFVNKLNPAPDCKLLDVFVCLSLSLSLSVCLCLSLSLCLCHSHSGLFSH